MKKLILIVGLILFSSGAMATKCLKATTIEELKNDFPVVIRGKVTSRTKMPKNENSFALKIHVERYIKGDLKKTELKATEILYGRGLPRPYEVGKVYTFPVDVKGKRGSYEVIIPAGGCPELPAE